MEDTQEREALIQEMLRDAKTTELPVGDPVVHKGDATLETPIVVRSITSAGYVYVWDTRTFEKIPVVYYMLPATLRKRRPDGSYRFTTVDPKQMPKQGTHKCFLHKDDPNRAHYDELGFKVCPKENITNPFQVQQHMTKKHPQEWKAIEAERKEKERQEDRYLQQFLLANALNKDKPAESGATKE